MQDNFHYEATTDIGEQQGRKACQRKGQRRLAAPAAPFAACQQHPELYPGEQRKDGLVIPFNSLAE